MTKEQAEKKAKELWGETGFAVVSAATSNSFIVGEENGPIRMAYGKGFSWENAFLKARFNLN